MYFDSIVFSFVQKFRNPIIPEKVVSGACNNGIKYYSKTPSLVSSTVKLYAC